MRRLLMVVVLSAYACASTYYESSSAGNDSNSGTSAAAARKTLGKVNSGTFVAGDRILLARGDVWRETLTPPSSGASGSPIVFDADGSGAAPEITAYQALPSWTQVSANLWAAPVTASGMNYVLFGTMWGTKQTTQAAVAHDRDFFLFGNTLYVFAPSNPTTYYGTVAAILLTKSQLIYVNGKSWLTFQHIKVDWFDQFGVNVAGASEDLMFANMEADGMVPEGTMPLGFYVNAASPGDLKFINVDAHLNYAGFRIDGAASAITLVNCKGYANRDGGLVDNRGGHATYSYSHFYATKIAIVNSQDVQGAIDGGNNLASDAAPAVVNVALDPVKLTFTIDDVGEAPGTEAYIDTLVPVFDARNLKLSAAVSPGYLVNTADVQSWLNDGHDINSHSWSHQYYTNLTAMNLRYTGTGTAASMSISGNRLTTAVTGGPGGENLDIDLTNAAYSSMLRLVTYINGRGVYTATEGTGLRDAVQTVGLADVAAHDIKTSYAVPFDKQRLVMDERAASKAWLQMNLTSLGNVKVYVYPDGIEDATTEGYAVMAGYEGARGGLSMGLGSNAVCSKGVNLQNIVSLGVAGFHGLTSAQIDAKVGALVFKAQAWGVPYGLFVHQNDLTAGEVGMLLDAIATHGGSVLTNRQLADWLHSAQNVTGTTNYVAPALNLRPTATAPVVKGGSNQGVIYGNDLLGASRPVPVSAAWDIGAYEILWTKHGGGSGVGHFMMGATTGVGTGENAYCGPGDVPAFGVSDATAALPQQCVYTAIAGTPSPGTVHTVAANCSDLQTQINNAAAGDTIVIPATATCVGSYTLPAKTGADANHWTTIRTDQMGNPAFTPEGSRTTPCMIGIVSIPGYPDYPCPTPAVLMPTVSSNVTNSPAIAVNGNFYRLIGLNLTKQTGTNMFYGTLLRLDGADHVICDRCLIHGSSNLDKLTKAGVSTRGTHHAIINSWIYNIDLNSPDGYCVSGGTGTQSDEMLPKLYNNLLACASESWLFGGGSVVAVPHDGEFRRNLSMKPLTWMLPIGADGTQNEPGPAGVNVKNLGEFKIGQRVLIEGNTYWQNWMGQSDQWGPVMGFAPKNQASVTNAKFVNVSGTTVTCAKDASGTPCAAGAGVFAFNIANAARTGDVVTIHTVSNGAAWTNGWVPPAHIVVQGMPLISGEDLNGQYPMISPTSSNKPNVVVFKKAGPDFAQVSWTAPAGGLVTDFIASTCAPGGCRFAAPKATGTLHINSVISSEQITTVETQATLTGATHQTCHPGQAFNAQVRDITIRYNRISHGAGVGIGQNNVGSDCSDEAQGVSNFSVHDNIADDIDGAFWNNGRNSCCGGGGVGTFATISNVYSTPSTWPHDVSIFHNTAVGLRGWPGSGSLVGGLGSMYAGFANTYFSNYTMRDNISLAPYRVGANVAAGLAANGCDPAAPSNCTWTFTKNLLATAVYAGYGQPSTAPYPATNQTCGTGSATCFPTTFIGMFVNWGNGLGDISANDYHLVPASPYKGQATDGKDLGADIDKVNLMTGTLPAFTYPPITVANTSLAACTNGVYCEQQLYLATGAGALWVRWKITSGTLPTGITFTGYSDGTGTGIGAGGWRGGTHGNAGWLWGTPTQSGSFPLTFQAEDAAHQKTSVTLTLVVN